MLFVMNICVSLIMVFAQKTKGSTPNLKQISMRVLAKLTSFRRDVGRVLLNLFNNAFYAVMQKKNTPGMNHYEPTVYISTKKIVSYSGAEGIEIHVKDNGTGIPQKAVDKVFQPFFTTKPAGQGTG